MSNQPMSVLFDIPIVFLVLIALDIAISLFQLAPLAFYSFKQNNTSTGVSVIVCAWNELENLKRLVPSILAFDYPDFELIIVDDRSNDGSYEYLWALRDKIKHVRIDDTPDHIDNKKYAITLGIKAAKNDWVLLTDADCYPQKNWISRMASMISEGTDFVLGVSQYNKKKSFLSRFIRFETIKTAISYVAMALLGRPYMGVGRNLMYRKEVFLKNKAFNHFNELVGGDDDLLVNALAKRKRTKVCLHPEATVFSAPKNKLSDYIKQKTRHLSVGVHYHWLDKFILGIITMSPILVWFSFITLAFTHTSGTIYFAALLILVKWVLQAITYFIFSKKIGDKFGVGFLPIYDFIYLVYYVLMGTKALLARNIKWN